MISYIETMVLVIIIIGSAELLLIYAVFKNVGKLFEKYKKYEERKNEKIKTEHHQSKNEEPGYQTH